MVNIFIQGKATQKHIRPCITIIATVSLQLPDYSMGGDPMSSSPNPMVCQSDMEGANSLHTT